MPTEDRASELIGADAAHAASVETSDAIEQAAEVNDDPKVAEALEDAAVKAEQATSRVGWLRSMLRRAFGRGQA